jgi:hypothetical protein
MKPKLSSGKRFHQGWTAIPIAAVLLFAPASTARGQVLYGSLVGTVTDSSGAAVPGATVTITQVETNQTRDTVASDVGSYTFTNVAAGTYEVVAALEGFQKFAAKGIVVQANRAVRVDAKLSVGGLEESVTVTAQQLLQTETAAVQTQLTRQAIENVPVNGRSFQSLLVLSPGVAQPNYFQTGGINNPSRSMQISVNGAPNQNTVVRIDGVSATNQWIEGLQSYSPAMDAIETVNVVTSSFDADQGMAGGASVNVQIKSGTNNFQGLGFEYLTTAALRSRNYFLPDDQEKTKDDKNVFGGTLGGPIKKDKVFYFVSVESTVQRSVGGPYATQASGSATQFLSLPPDSIRGGDFSQTGTVIYDPLTGNPDGTGRTAFPGNVIPANRINPVARNLLALLPSPQYAGTANNYFATPKYNSDFHKIDSKITWNASNKLNLNGRFSYLPANEHAWGLYPGVGQEFNALALGTTLNSNVTSSSITATSILTPSFVIDGIFGFTRQHTYQEPPGPKTCWGQEVGIPNSCQPGQRDYVLPRIDINGWSSYGNGTRVNDNTGSLFDYLDPQYQWVVNASWNKGAHNVKFGADVHRLEMNHYEVTSAFFNFSGGATALNGGSAPNLYNGFADFLLGMPNQRQSSLLTPLLNDDSGGDQERPLTLRSWEYGIYLRDQWQVNRKLTLSLGLRWEYYPVSLRSDRGMEVFDFATNQLRICGVGNNDSSCGVKVQKDLFTPRIGVAYRAKESLVFRAGFSRNPQNNNMGRGQLRNFPAEIAVLASGANSFANVGSISNGFPVFPVLDLASGAILLPPGTGVTTWDPSTTFVRGQITMFNVSAQIMLPHSLSAQVAYVGNRQDDIFRNINLNYGQIGGGAASQPFNQPGLVNGLRTTSAINIVRPLGRVQYDSLQASVTRRMSGGFQLNGAYTYAKTTDWWAGNIAIPEYFYLNKGIQALNTPHKLDISAVYELPFGPGRKFLSDGGILGALFGNWQVNGLFSAASGQPFTVSSSTASLNAPGSTTQLADQIKDPEILGGVGPTTPYFDVTAFRPVTEARFGNAGFNTLRGPGAATLDTSFFRTFSLSSDTKLQFRFEIFNLTNRANFANPGGLNVSSLQLNPDGTVRNLNGFGVISGTNSVGREYAERYARVGVRVTF